MPDTFSPHPEPRRLLRRIFQHTVAECSMARAFERQIDFERGVLRVKDDLHALADFDRVFLASIGKAAYTMVEALAGSIKGNSTISNGGQLWGSSLSGIVTGPNEPERMVSGLEYFRGGHPLPTAESVRAGEAILRGLRGLTERSLVIFLLSGGGSALVEKPMQGISLDDLVATYRALVHSSAPIAQINAVRKHLSATKGGRLSVAASPARQVSLMISDVPENALDSLASGPTMPDSSTVEDCYRIAAEHDLLRGFSPAVRQMFAARALEETPKAGDASFTDSRWHVLLSSADAEREASKQAVAEGFHVVVDNSCDDWDYTRAADYLLEKLRTARQKHQRVCIVSGGEVTVKVSNGGSGGRNQQFALYCASRIAGEIIALLSGGTDGIDGNSVAAGAVVDGTTVARAEARGLNVGDALAHFNSFPLPDALGDTIITGPTGTNVRDIRVLMAW